ncbi:MAG: hypothetical protein U0354_19820 [Candidatus Sericytochromatia bacterium]
MNELSFWSSVSNIISAPIGIISLIVTILATGAVIYKIISKNKIKGSDNNTVTGINNNSGNINVGNNSLFKNDIKGSKENK